MIKYCPDCSGYGRVKGECCNTCKGLGYIEEQPEALASVNTTTKGVQPMEFVIEDNVPIPEKSPSKAKEDRWPLVQMKAMQSFFVPTATKEEATAVNRSVAAFARHRKIKVHKANVDGGVRVWRME